MAEGRLQSLRALVVAQATLFGSAASAAQVTDFVRTGWLECTPSGSDPPPLPYDSGALRTLVESGMIG
jgi:hypothetical protein